MQINLKDYHLSEAEVIEILEAFQTQTMNNLLRSAHKSPRFEVEPDEDFFSTYSLYDISSNILSRKKNETL